MQECIAREPVCGVVCISVVLKLIAIHRLDLLFRCFSTPVGLWPPVHAPLVVAGTAVMEVAQRVRLMC